MNNTFKVRRSVRELQTDYENGKKEEVEKLLKAWKTIKELPASDPNSFFMIGGFHGEPFRGAGWGTNTFWGGYCNHGNVLFPTWHRAYLIKLEEALQSVEGCETVMMPYWDETSQESLDKGIPWLLTQDKIEFDGCVQDNPLKSFVFNKNIVDNISGDNPNYSKPKGYETVRYPLSGLVGTDDDKERTKQHNAMFPDYDKNVTILNNNVRDWLTSNIVVEGKVIETNTNKKFKDCLNAPNYTVFSNTTSAQEYNANLPEGAAVVMPLESPHNDIHLAVGGCEVPNYNRSPIPNANGDMGENDTAGLDPIFYFHHCNVDRVFWLWQKKHQFTDHLEIIPEYPGTNSVDSQGPTPGVTPNSWLDLDSPLNPFKLIDSDGKSRPYTSKDVINIECQLGYTYSKGSLEEEVETNLLAASVKPSAPQKVIHVSRINKANVRGSFTISAFAMIDGEKKHLGTDAVLSRWGIKGCANCQTHLEVKSFFPLNGLSDKISKENLSIEIHGRNRVLAGPQEMLLGAKPKEFHMEIK